MFLFTWLSAAMYVVLIIVGVLIPDAVKFNSMPVRNPLLRALVIMIVLPIFGIIFWIIGLLGRFLLLPFTGPWS